MTWVLALLAVAVLGVTAVVATGRGGSLQQTYDDRPDARVPATGPLTAADLAQVRFTTAFRGYRASEVDALLARLGRELAARQDQQARPDAQPDARTDAQQDIQPDVRPEPGRAPGEPGSAHP